MSDPRRPLVIIGVGNVFFGDDGVGVHVVRGIRHLAQGGEAGLPSATDLVDGGTMGLGLADVVASARALIIVDAAEIAGPPGTVTVVPADAVAGAGLPTALCIAGGVGGLMDAARLLGTLPAACSVVCVRPATTDPGMGLSPAVGTAIPTAIAVTLREARRLDRTATSALEPRAGRHVVGAFA